MTFQNFASDWRRRQKPDDFSHTFQKCFEGWKEVGKINKIMKAENCVLFNQGLNLFSFCFAFTGFLRILLHLAGFAPKGLGHWQRPPTDWLHRWPNQPSRASSSADMDHLQSSSKVDPRKHALLEARFIGNKVRTQIIGVCPDKDSSNTQDRNELLVWTHHQPEKLDIFPERNHKFWKIHLFHKRWKKRRQIKKFHETNCKWPTSTINSNEKEQITKS